MKKSHLILGLILLAALATVAWFGLVLLGRWLGNLNPNVAAAIITAVVGLTGLWYVQWHTRAREIAESHRKSKIEVYNVFFDIVERFQDEFVEANFEKREDVPDWLRKEFQKLNRGLIIWGSPEVIKAWLYFREISGQGNPKVLVAVDKMYQAIRKDLGNSNFGLQTGDLLKSTLSDPENWGKWDAV